MTYSEEEAVYRKVVYVAKKASTNPSSVVCEAPEPRIRGHVIKVSSTVPINISQLVRKFPGAEIYGRGDRGPLSIEIGYDALTVYGPVQYIFKWWMLAAVWTLAGATWAHSIINI